MSNTRIRKSFNSQKTLMYAAQFHFNTSLKGICAGYALTGALCFFSETLVDFDTAISCNYQSFSPFLSQDATQAKKENAHLSTTEQDLQILSAIFAFQKPRFFTYFFKNAHYTQNDISSLIFTFPLPRIVTQSNITIIRQYLKFFTHHQLSKVLSSLAQELKSKLVFVLSYCSHRISIGYHPTLNTYFYINANTAPTKPYSAPELAKKIKRMFANFGLRKINFYIRLLILTSEVDKINNSLNNLEKKSTFQSLISTNKHDFFMRTLIADNLMHVCARVNNIELLKKYTLYFDPNEQNNLGTTPLHIACKANYPAAAKALLDNPNTEADAISKKGKTALYYAVERGNVELTRMLLEKGCNPYGNKKAHSPLMHAVDKNQIQFLKTCREFGINLFKKNEHGKTLLDQATESQKEEIVDYLSSLKTSTSLRFFIKHRSGPVLKNSHRKRHYQPFKTNHPAPQQKRQKSANS